MRAIQQLIQEARRYAENYPNVIDDEVREALYYSHLVYLINSQTH